ncbi:MAG: hypothetical protein AAB486_02510 [Patescibacteria group bacterium]
MDWKLLLDYTKAITWPFIVSCSLIYFRSSIRNLIAGIKSIKGPGDTQIDIGDQIEEQNKKTKELQEEDLNKSVDTNLNKIKDEYEEKIKSLGDNERKLQNELANTQVYLGFERIYNFIFGSQIRLLEFLNRVTHLTNTGQNGFFQGLQNQYPIHKNYNIGDYLSFLFNSGLIANDEEGNIMITNTGKAFLSYIEILKYSKIKPL